MLFSYCPSHLTLGITPHTDRYAWYAKSINKKAPIKGAKHESQPSSKKKLHIDLFSGIGGFALAADRVFGDIEHIFVENDPFCQEVLRKHWATAPIRGDINNVVLDLEAGISIMNLCENPVHTVNKKKEPPIQTGGRNVSQKRRGNDSTEAQSGTRNTNNESVNIPHDSEKKSSALMEENVPVAEKKSRHSSPLTTEMGEERKKGKRKSAQGSLSTEVLSKEDSLKNTDSSAITATTEHTDSVLAHIKNERPFILTGGFPCQSFSQAGRRKGTADARWLWPQMFRVIQLTKPEWCIAENVRGLTNWEGGLAFGQVLSDLESEGYSTQTFIIPAVAVGAPHRRDRVWFVAHRNDAGGGTPERETLAHGAQDSEERQHSFGRIDGQDSDAPDTTKAIRQRRRGAWNGRQRPTNESWNQNWLEVAQRFCQLDDGLPYRLAGFIGDTCAIMGYLLLVRDNFYGTKNSTRTEETLSALQKATTSEAFSKLLRGYGEIQKEEVLRCSVHGESNDERESKPWSLLNKSEKAQRKEMRKVWHDKLAEHPPYQRGLDGQCSCKFDDIVRELSSPIALAEWEENAKEATDILFSLWQKSRGIGVLHEPLQALQEVWKSLTDKEIGSFRRHYYLRNDNRNPRLKALGNAIVAQVAEEIMRAIQQTSA